MKKIHALVLLFAITSAARVLAFTHLNSDKHPLNAPLHFTVVRPDFEDSNGKLVAPYEKKMAYMFTPVRVSTRLSKLKILQWGPEDKKALEIKVPDIMATQAELKKLTKEKLDSPEKLTESLQELLRWYDASSLVQQQFPQSQKRVSFSAGDLRVKWGGKVYMDRTQVDKKNGLILYHCVHIGSLEVAPQK